MLYNLQVHLVTMHNTVRVLQQTNWPAIHSHLHHRCDYYI
jgi:hypothetical protein